MEKIRNILKNRQLRNNILFVLAMLFIFRVVAHIPIPGIDTTTLSTFLDSNQALQLLNLFSGGGLENFSIVMLGLGPYITASIIMQLMGMVIPTVEEWTKEGEAGQRKISNYTKILTVPLSFLQGYGMIALLQRSTSSTGAAVLGSLSVGEILTILVTITAGGLFLVWLGELITEKNVGNGISILIFAGIIAALPGQLSQTFSLIDSSEWQKYLLLVGAAVAVVAGVVFITEGVRKVTVIYARQSGQNRTYLPIRVNQGGVIPIIFGISVLIFPQTVAQYFIGNETAWIDNAAVAVNNFFANQVYYGIVYFVLVFAFTYFYTSIIFQPDKVADNLNKQGGFIPGVRPGKETSNYIGHVSNRIMLFGAIFLGAVAVLPLFVESAAGISTLGLSGTSLLIIVSVALEFNKQLDASLMTQDYDTL
jgi:preprotein translocase subunit SecY